MEQANALKKVLTALSVPRDRVLYVHSSMDWLSRAGVRLGDALNTLIDWTDRGGTLVFPAFPFRGSHEAYLQGRPTFDVRRTPVRVGLLNETLRRRKGVKRSLDPDLSVIAVGWQADAVIGTGFTGPDPTGPDSPFQRVIALNGALLGLGVSFNYMNMIHVLDSRYRESYPFEIYSNVVYSPRTIDAAGRLHEVAKQAMLNELQVHIKPSEIVRVLRPGCDVFRNQRIDDVDFFIWNLRPWESLCVTHIQQALDAGSFPCWLTEVSRALSGRKPRLGVKS